MKVDSINLIPAVRKRGYKKKVKHQVEVSLTID